MRGPSTPSRHRAMSRLRSLSMAALYGSAARPFGVGSASPDRDGGGAADPRGLHETHPGSEPVQEAGDAASRCPPGQPKALEEPRARTPRVQSRPRRPARRFERLLAARGEDLDGVTGAGRETGSPPPHRASRHGRPSRRRGAESMSLDHVPGAPEQARDEQGQDQPDSPTAAADVADDTSRRAVDVRCAAAARGSHERAAAGRDRRGIARDDSPRDGKAAGGAAQRSARPRRRACRPSDWTSSG